jgi:hypothetical protein
MRFGDPIGMEREQKDAAERFERFMKTGRVEDYLAYVQSRKEWPQKP